MLIEPPTLEKIIEDLKKVGNDYHMVIATKTKGRGGHLETKTYKEKERSTNRYFN